MLGRSALLAATNSENYGNWLGNYSDVSLLLRGNETPLLVPFDESPSPKTVTANGNAQISTAQSKFGGASIAFDGSGDYLTLNNVSSLRPGTTDYTLELWYYKTSNINTGNFINQTLFGTYWSGSSPTGAFILFATSDDAKIRFLIWGGASLTSTSDIQLQAWHHIAVVKSGTTYSLYINGINEASATSSIVADNSTYPIVVGWYRDPAGNGFSGFFDGYIDDLRITKGIARYTSNFTPPTTELPANITDDPSYNSVSLLLRGNGTPSSTLALLDESPTPKTITVTGNAGISTATFKYGDSSLAFDGNGDRLTLAASSAWDFSGGPHTIECWLWLNAYPSVNCRFLQAGPNDSSSSFSLFSITPSGVLYLGRPRFGSTGMSFPTAIPLNQWVHLALVMNSAGATLLAVNGVSVTASVTLPTATTGNALYIGQDPTVGSSDNAVLNGYIDDLRITKGVARYTKNFLPPPAELPAI